MRCVIAATHADDVHNFCIYKKENPNRNFLFACRECSFFWCARIQHDQMPLSLASVMKRCAMSVLCYRTTFTHVWIALKSHEMCKIGTFKCKHCHSLWKSTLNMNAASFSTAKFIIWGGKNRVKYERQTKLNTCKKGKWTLQPQSRPANDQWMAASKVGRCGTDVEETTSKDQINAYYLCESSANHGTDTPPNEAAPKRSCHTPSWWLMAHLNPNFSRDCLGLNFHSCRCYCSFAPATKKLKLKSICGLCSVANFAPSQIYSVFRYQCSTVCAITYRK